MAKLDAETRRRKGPHVTKDDIEEGLRELGLERGAVVGVHSSLSSFGYVEGGADAVIDAILDTVGPEGSVVFPTYSNNRRDLERTPDEIEMGVTWKYKVLPYDPKEASCWTGRIPDTFRRREGVVRGTNPTHSLSAVGPEKHGLARGWHKLLELDGSILLIGVGLGCCSSMHLAEKGFELPERILKRTTPPAELRETLRREDVHFGFGPYPDFARMEEPCREHRILRTRPIGEAQVKLLRLRGLIDLYARALGEDPDVFYEAR